MATSSRPTSRWLKIVLGALVLVVVVAVCADWWQANREMDTLLDEVEDSENQVTVAVENLEYTIRFSTLAGLDDTASEEAREAARVEVGRQLAVACARAAKAIQDSGKEVEDVQILPWHRSLRDARAAYLYRNGAWVSLFVAGATEPPKLVDPVLGDRVRSTSDSSRSRLHDAKPPWARHDAGDRIDRIFGEAQEPPS